MKLLIALRDVKTGTFLAPVVVSTPGEAERWYETVLAKGPELVRDHPKDFPLYEIGKFDEQTGEVFALIHESGAYAPPRLLVESGQLLQLSKEA